MTRLNNSFWRAGALSLLAGLIGAGCATDGSRAYFLKTKSKANVFVAPVASSIHKVAVLPFRAPTELIGSSISDEFVTEMLRTERYEMVERSQMAKVLGESELALAGLSASRAIEVGAMFGADGVVLGTVDEYSTVAHRGHPYPVVGISLRLIDCSSGKVMWSADLAKKAERKRMTMPEQSRITIHELVAGLYQKWDVQPQISKEEPLLAAPPKAERPAAPVSRTKIDTAVPPAPPVPRPVQPAAPKPTTDDELNQPMGK